MGECVGSKLAAEGVTKRRCSFFNDTNNQTMTTGYKIAHSVGLRARGSPNVLIRRNKLVVGKSLKTLS